MPDINKPVLVLGATGKTGRRIAERLRRAGREIRFGSRSAYPPFDWQQPAGWDAALKGVGAVYIAYQPDLAVPGAVDIVGDFVARAKAAGTDKLVLLSGRGEPEAQEAEAIVAASGLDYTILRASWFFQNFSEGLFLPELLRGTLTIPENTSPEPFLDIEDLADIGAEALQGERHRGRTYDLTGPEALTFEEVVMRISRAAGKPITVSRVPIESYRDHLLSAGVTPEEAEFVVYLFTTVLDGRNIKPENGVAEALGRKPRNVDDFVTATAPTGVWNG